MGSRGSGVTVKSNRQHAPLLQCIVGLSQLAMMKHFSKRKPEPPKAMLTRSEGYIRYLLRCDWDAKICALYPVPHLSVLLIIICQLKSPSV